MTPAESSYGQPSLRLPGLRSDPLSLDELHSLYEATDWRIVAFHSRGDRAYGTFTPTSMLKALALPYLVNIQSESALARELKERQSLRVLCGFAGQGTPTRAMFWHFRHTPEGLYPDFLLRALIAMVLSAQPPRLDLPFVLPDPYDSEVPSGGREVIQMDPYSPEVQVWTERRARSPARVDTAGRTVSQLYEDVRKMNMSTDTAGGRGLPPLPARVLTQVAGEGFVRFVIDRPDWLRPRAHWPNAGTDAITSLGPSRGGEYSACHMIVLRWHGERTQVLLSRRLAGYGTGLYALPCGKAGETESLESCVHRELREETGLTVQQSRPVSVWRERDGYHPAVLEVGALVEEFEGEPTRQEPMGNSQWEWFDLDSLPAAVFPPSRRVLEAFRDRRFPDLRWSDLETLHATGA